MWKFDKEKVAVVSDTPREIQSTPRSDHCFPMPQSHLENFMSYLFTLKMAYICTNA